MTLELNDCHASCSTCYFIFCFRDRPAAYTPDVKSITDTSNFDEFPEVDLKISMFPVNFLLFELGRVNILSVKAVTYY